MLKIEGIVIGYGTSVHHMFETRYFDEKSPLSERVHLAFNASCKEDVNDLYKSAITSGGKCSGETGFRPQCEDGYYVIFIDLFKHNIAADIGK